ncbi:MAG: hypothetical protein ACRC6D_00860 [Aeromonas sp.]
MKVGKDVDTLRSFFERHPNLGAPFVNAFSVKCALIKYEKISIPIMILSNTLFEKICARLDVSHRYSGYPQYIHIEKDKTKKKHIKEIAHFAGRLDGIFLYRIILKNNFSCMGKAHALLANLSTRASKHCDLKVNITQSKGEFTVYSGLLGNYITCEELND